MPRDLVVVALALFTWGLGEGMFLYFQPLALQQWGADPLEIGAVLSVVGVAMAAAQAPAGYLSDRIGAQPVMRAAWVLGFASTILMAFAPSLPIFIAGLVIYGTTSFVNPPMTSYITTMRGDWNMERALTVVVAMFHLGTVTGPVVGGYISARLGLLSIYRFAAIIFFFSTVIIFLARRPVVQSNIDTHIETKAGPAPRNLMRNPHFLGLLVMIFFTMFSLYLPQPLTSIFLKDQQGFSVQQIGQMGAIASLGNAAILLLLGHLRAPIGMLVGQALVSLYALLLWQGDSPLAFYSAFLFIGGYRLYRSMALAYTRSTIRAEEAGLAFGLVETVGAMSIILAPLAAGALYSYRPTAVYSVSLGAIVLMLLLNHFGPPAAKKIFMKQSLKAGLTGED